MDGYYDDRKRKRSRSPDLKEKVKDDDEEEAIRIARIAARAEAKAMAKANGGNEPKSLEDYMKQKKVDEKSQVRTSRLRGLMIVCGAQKSTGGPGDR